MVTIAEKKRFVEYVLSTYMESEKLTIWMGNQLFGLARQSIDHTTDGKQLPTPILNVPAHNGDEENNVAEKED